MKRVTSAWLAILMVCSVTIILFTQSCIATHASFTYSPNYPTTDDVIQFIDTSTFSGTSPSWYWEFGDGSSSTLQNSTHKYSSPGTYTVKLTVTDSYGGSSISKDLHVSQGTGGEPKPAPLKYIVSFEIKGEDGAMYGGALYVNDKFVIAMGGQVVGGGWHTHDKDVTYSPPIVRDPGENKIKFNATFDTYIRNVKLQVSDGRSAVDTGEYYIPANSSREWTLTLKGAEKGVEGKEGAPLLWMWIILGGIIGVIIIVAVIIGVRMAKMRKPSYIIEKPKLTMPPPARPVMAVPAITLRCPNCKSTFKVEVKEKPFKVKCPSCGTEGMIR